jgi:cyclic dehypoxanthinyl futalosine synthase
MTGAEPSEKRGVRVASVGYLNAQPLVCGLDADARFAVDFGLPSEVARRLAEDEADVALMPVAAAAAIGDVKIVPGMAIGSRGPVRSVAIFSERPVEELEEVVLDLSSRTSVVLARLVLAKRNPRVRFLGMNETDARASIMGKRGALVIGDPALSIEKKFPHVLDLASAWREMTGLPFVFAAWCTRGDALDLAHVEALLSAKERGRGESRALAEEHAKKSGLGVESLEQYLQSAINYDLGEAEIKGLQRFFDEAAAARLLPKTKVHILSTSTQGLGSSRSGLCPDTPNLAPSAPQPDARTTTLDTLLARAADGERLSMAEGHRLAMHASLFDLGLAADSIRQRKHPHGVVTYIVDRNVNYTNVCTTSCRFCAFYRPVGHPEGWTLSREVLGKKLQEVVDAGGVQILLQGGLNPELRIEWYEDLFRWMKREYKLGLHALSPEEILFIARQENLTTRRVLERLHAAGLDSVPGGGAEILVDRVRRKIAKAKCTSEEWLGVMRVAHQMGLRSSGTMMYGTTDTALDRVLHLGKLRDLQDETGGFTAFFCWDFQHETGTKIAAGEHGTLLYLRQQAIARIMLDNFDHVGASWVTQGPEVGQVALRFGADDFGSVMFEENVVSSAGTTFRMNAGAMEERIHAAGFKAARRNVRYDWLTPPA